MLSKAGESVLLVELMNRHERTDVCAALPGNRASEDKEKTSTFGLGLLDCGKNHNHDYFGRY